MEDEALKNNKDFNRLISSLRLHKPDCNYRSIAL